MPEREFGLRNQDFSNKRLTAVGIEILRRNSGDLNPQELDKAFTTGRWSKIAEALRKYPRDVQELVALDFFGPKGGNFPNGVELAEFLVRINNIPWFSSESRPDGEKLQQYADQFAKDINLGHHPVRLILGNWERMNIRGINEMWDQRINAMKVPVFSALKANGRWQAATVAMDAAEGCVNAAIHMGWQKTHDVSGKAWGVARSAAANASIYAKYAVSSILAHDVIESHMRDTAAFRKSNPMDGLFKIYEMGAIPVGAHYGGYFIVFWPMN